MGIDSPPICVGEASDIEAFLAERIYEHNAEATRYFDAQSFHAVQRDRQGRIQAGISGFTWGGCCHVSYLWVARSSRRRGLGSRLLASAEDHARSVGCRLVVLSSHSFQAPGFYERRGYERQGEIRDFPWGHTDVLLVKHLEPG